jgi:glycosyltransferase involved in cell wall biosynthesis
MPRHQVLARLAQRMPVVWLDYPRPWRENLLRPKSDPQPLKGQTPAASRSFHIHTPRRWEGQFYRPEWLGRLTRASYLNRARRVLRRSHCDELILYLWRPEFEYELQGWDWDLTLYHIDDEYSFSDTEIELGSQERRIIESVDQVIVHSPGLMQRKGGVNPNTVEVPNGVDYAAFAARHEEPTDLASIPRPRVGYVGIIKKQLDLELLIELARRHSSCSFVFVGPLLHSQEIAPQVSSLRSLQNVHFLGERAPHELPAYMQHLDAGLLCYRVNAYTNCIYPLKLNEYLAAGIPTIGSKIRTLLDYAGVISLASGLDDWSAAIEVALQPASHKQEVIAARRSVAKEHDWNRIATRIASLIDERLATAEPRLDR